MIWKKTLHEYVHLRNQMDMDYSVEPLLPFMRDEAYLHGQKLRLERRQWTDRDRGYIPLKSETRLSISRFQEQEGQVAAEVILRRAITGETHGLLHEERRVEREKIVLQPEEGAGWIIAGIEYLDHEGGLRLKPSVPGSMLEVVTEYDESDMMRAPSVPFLNRSMLPQLEPLGPRRIYNRAEAARYADQWWERGNPAYLTFEVDCSNYVSQCLFAGGAPMNYTDRRDAGWWYKGRSGGRELWSYSWAVAQSLQFYLLKSPSGLRAREVDSAGELQPGDVISYDWDGDGRFQHTTIVAALDARGMPLVNAHTVSSRHRYWSYTDSPAYTSRTRYRFLHINDSL